MTTRDHALAVLLLAITLGACGTPQPPEGRLACTRDRDCPHSWVCRDNEHGQKRCYHHDANGSLDSGAADSGSDAGGSVMDAASTDAMIAKPDASHAQMDAAADAMTPAADAAIGDHDAGPSADAGCDGGAAASCVLLDPPRPIAPVSTGYVTSHKPRFRYALASDSDGARVEICSDRACKTVVTHFDLTGTSGQPSKALPSGVLFFRLYSLISGTLASGPSATWQFVVGAEDTSVATSYGTQLDINGDGLGDLAAGAPDAVVTGDLSTSVQLGPGRAYVYLGSKTAKADWAIAQPKPKFTLIDPDAISGDLFGSQVVSAGDLDGDGFADLAVSAPCAPKSSSYCGMGKVHLYRGGAKGLSATMPQPDLTLSTSGDGADFGVAVAAGDYDGDGYSDLAVGADGATAVYVFRGGPAIFDAASLKPTWTLSGPSSFGSTAANIGDANGDGFADLLIGSPSDGGSSGAVYAFYGGAANGFAPGHTPKSVRFISTTGSSNFGAAVGGAFDVNGDGYTDALVGSGTAFLYFGGDGTGLDTANPIAFSTSPMYGSELLGQALGGAGDVDGDGHADILVAGPGFTPTPTVSGAGRALFMSGPTPATDTALVLAEGSKASQFASVVKAATDLDGDGYADVVVGTPRYLENAPLYGSPGDHRGKLSIWFGSASSIATASDATIDGPDGMGGRFGF